MFTDHFS